MSSGNVPTISNDFQIMPRKNDTVILLPMRDWKRICEGIKKFSEGRDWWEISLSAFIGVAVTLWTIILFGGNDVSNYELLLRTACITTATIVVILFAMKSLKKYNSSTKQTLLEDIRYVEDSFDIEAVKPEDTDVEPETKKIEKSTLKKTQNRQGLNYLPLEFPSGLLNSASFMLSSISTYWRAGFKLMKPNASSEICTLSPDTALFHLTRTETVLGLDVYPEGKSESHFKKVIEGVNISQPINITIDRNENNYVNLYINDVVQYSGRFDPDLFKKVAILVWGDNHDYDLTVDNVEYSYS